jgi:hypothetical protein
MRNTIKKTEVIGVTVAMVVPGVKEVKAAREVVVVVCPDRRRRTTKAVRREQKS